MNNMSDIFLKTLNMSIAAGWLILAVVPLRFVLKKAPKWTVVLLWGIVGLRLAVPFSFESALSLIPSTETFNAHNIQYETPAISSGIPAVNSTGNPVLGETFASNPADSVNPLYAWTFASSVIWLIGIVTMLLYAVVSYVRVHKSVAERVPCEGNIFLCDHVKSPFILGLIRPKIYLPSNMDAMAMEPVITHEKAHLARRDHWWKPIGFLILTVHWFNPLCWAAYVLLCRDIELACDEKVIRQMDVDGKKRYSTALLECSAGRRSVTMFPLAFGEVGVKTRVKNVLHYKKPAFWVIAAAVIACAGVMVCFATSPISAENSIRLQSARSTPPAAFFSLDLAEGELQGTVIAERWANGRCVSTNPVFINNHTQQIQLYLDPQENGVNVQLGVDNGDTILENFSYPEGGQPVGWSFVSLEEGKKETLQLGKDRIIAAMAFDFGTGVTSYSCDTLSTDKKQMENAAYMIVIRASFADNSDFLTAEPGTPNAERPTLIMNGDAYVDPYMPISSLPYGYQSAGKLTSEQAGNTGLEGIEYFVHPSETEDFYTYQECGTPIDLNTVDSEKRQWAYMRWILVKNDGMEHRKLTLDDTVMLSQKKDALTWSDFERYQGQDIGSGLYIMRYKIDELFEVLVGGIPYETPMYIYLRVNNEADDRIDIRTENVSAFIEAHRNDEPKAVEAKPDGGGSVPEEPDSSTLSDEQAVIRRAILDHNRSAFPTGHVSCASFVELACIAADEGGFSQHIHYGWTLYEVYKVTDDGLKSVGGAHAAAAITLREDSPGTFTLAEYWEPRPGSYLEQDIREKFPADIAEDGIDSQKFILQQIQECYEQAIASAGLDTDSVIETLIETICSSPSPSSNPGAYIKEHPIEYRELTYYGQYTLKYCFARFEEGGETGLDGHIMMGACEDIAAGWGEEPLVFSLPTNGVLTGQMWYSAFKNNALRLMEQYTETELAKAYPASYLLLSMLGEI